MNNYRSVKLYTTKAKKKAWNAHIQWLKEKSKSKQK